MIGVPLQVLQAKTAGQIVDELPHDASVMNRTAVVLPDEQLLLPVLYSLPDHIEDINTTAPTHTPSATKPCPARV